VKARFLAMREELDASVASVQRRLEEGREPASMGGDAAVIFAGISRLGGVINGGESASILQRSAEQALVDSFFA